MIKFYFYIHKKLLNKNYQLLYLWKIYFVNFLIIKKEYQKVLKVFNGLLFLNLSPYSMVNQYDLLHLEQTY